MADKGNGPLKKLSEFRYVLLVAAVGLLLILWPTGSTSTETVTGREEELRVAALLSQIEGVGEAQVLLSDSGAVVVCDGADSASVCLKITRAVKCYTGLGADEVQIFKSE